MLTLNADECRVLGTLVEKAQTTPGQYPMTLNGLMRGCNQTSGRDPITHFDEERVFDIVDALRRKGIVREAMLSDSRVAKFRHVAREALGVNTEELVLLAELMLRGPQSAGELRSRAGRMMPNGQMGLLDTLETTEGVLRGLASRGEGAGALVKEIPAAPGQRARRWMQLLCPGLHPVDHVGREEEREERSERREGGAGGAGGSMGAGPAGTSSPSPASSGGLLDRVGRLEREVGELRAALSKLCATLGEEDPFTS